MCQNALEHRGQPLHADEPVWHFVTRSAVGTVPNDWERGHVRKGACSFVSNESIVFILMVVAFGIWLVALSPPRWMYRKNRDDR